MKTIIYFVLLFCFVSISAGQPDIPLLIDKVISGVVLVQTDSSIGSGVIVSSEGFILTNYHVIRSADENKSNIVIKTHNKESFKVIIIDFDDDLDICLLKTSRLDNEFVFPIVNPDSIKVGQDVICIGNPFGVSDYVTKGIISKFNTPYIFTTSSINPGNSGGAMVNMKGELVGMPTMRLEDAQNFNIALCPRTIKYFLKKNNIKYK